MALPVTVDSINNPEYADQNYFVGPFKAPNQAIYLVTRDTSLGMQVYKATDPTDSFTRQDNAGKPFFDDYFSFWAYLSGSEIHIATAGPSGGGVTNRYQVFDTASDTWTTVNETIEDVKDEPAGSSIATSIAVRSDGDVIVLYNGDQDNDMGNPFERVDYARREGGSWTVGIDVGGTTPAAEDRIGGVIVRGSADNMHLFFGNEDNASGEWQGRTLDAANSLSAIRTLDLGSATFARPHYWNAGIAWNDSGTWRVSVPTVDRDTDELVMVRWVESSGDLAASPGTTVVGSPEDVTFISPDYPVCAVVDGDGQMYVMWSGGGAGGNDLDLYRDDATPPYTSWSGETEVINATTINRISCNIYPRDGAIKLAFVYDEAGTIKYNEVSISAPTAPAMADSRFPDQNYKVGPFSV